MKRLHVRVEHERPTAGAAEAITKKGHGKARPAGHIARLLRARSGRHLEPGRSRQVPRRAQDHDKPCDAPLLGGQRKPPERHAIQQFRLTPDLDDHSGWNAAAQGLLGCPELILDACRPDKGDCSRITAKRRKARAVGRSHFPKRHVLHQP